MTCTLADVDVPLVEAGLRGRVRRSPGFHVPVVPLILQDKRFCGPRSCYHGLSLVPLTFCTMQGPVLYVHQCSHQAAVMLTFESHAFVKAGMEQSSEPEHSDVERSN